MKKFLITILFISTVKFLLGQDKIVQGTFTHDSLTFTVSNALKNRYKIQSNKWDNLPDNPTLIDGIESQAILRETTITNISKYKNYIQSLPNLTELTNNGEIIKIYYLIDGKGNILDIAFYISKSTKFTISNIKGLYDYIRVNEKPTINSYKHYSQFLKSIIISISYDLNELILINPKI